MSEIPLYHGADEIHLNLWAMDLNVWAMRDLYCYRHGRRADNYPYQRQACPNKSGTFSSVLLVAIIIQGLTKYRGTSLRRQVPTPLGPPQDPRHRPMAGF